MTLEKNIRRGQIHKHETGYLAGAWCYGYDHGDDIDRAFTDSFDRRRPCEAAHDLRYFGAEIGSLGVLHRRIVRGDLGACSRALAKQNSGILFQNGKKE